MPEDGLELHAKWNINTGVEVRYVIDGVTYKTDSLSATQLQSSNTLNFQIVSE